MPDSSADRDVLDVLAEEFVARFRAGVRPSLTEYANRLPGRADELATSACALRSRGPVILAARERHRQGTGIALS
jgi:hypothetical protein